MGVSVKSPIGAAANYAIAPRTARTADTSATIEPIPGMSMMWGTSMRGMGSVMGSPRSWYSAGTGAATSLDQAVTAANRWLAKSRHGETAEGDGHAYPGYFMFDTTHNGETHGMLSVSRLSGAIWSRSG